MKKKKQKPETKQIIIIIMIIIIIIVSLAVLALYGHRDTERFDYNLRRLRPLLLRIFSRMSRTRHASPTTKVNKHGIEAQANISPFMLSCDRSFLSETNMYVFQGLFHLRKRHQLQKFI